MNTFILISACLFWFCIIFCALFIVFAQSNARTIKDDNCYIYGQKCTEKAPQSDDLTLSRYMDALKEAAQMEFNDSVITSHDLNQIDSLL